MVGVFAFAVYILSYSFGIASPTVRIEHVEPIGSTTSPLDAFQIQAPLRKSYDGVSCQQIIVQHNFAASYGTPYVGKKFELCLSTQLMKSRNIHTTQGLRVHYNHLQPLIHLDWHQL
jgi:hypothetical protein